MGYTETAEATWERITFELVKLLIHFAKVRKNLLLLDVIFENNVLSYRFDKLHIHFAPDGNWNGNVHFVVERSFVFELHTDLLRFKKLNHPTRQAKRFDGQAETRNYDTLKGWNGS